LFGSVLSTLQHDKETPSQKKNGSLAGQYGVVPSQHAGTLFEQYAHPLDELLDELDELELDVFSVQLSNAGLQFTVPPMNLQQFETPFTHIGAYPCWLHTGT